MTTKETVPMHSNRPAKDQAARARFWLKELGGRLQARRATVKAARRRTT